MNCYSYREGFTFQRGEGQADDKKYRLVCLRDPLLSAPITQSGGIDFQPNRQRMQRVNRGGKCNIFS